MGILVTVAAAQREFFPAGVAGHFKTHDFDDTAATPPLWEQQYWQLGRGRFVGEMFMAHTARMGVGVVSYWPGIMIRGHIPRGSTMLAIPLRRDGTACYRGEDFSMSAVGLLHSG